MKHLIKENQLLSTAIIKERNQHFANGQILLQKLNELGLELTKLDSWNQVDEFVKTAYPKAAISFCLEAQGITEPYNEAKKYYDSKLGQLAYTPLTDAAAEQIKESNRVYATTQKELEVVQLFNSVKNNLLRLQELGIRIDVNKAYLLNRTLSGFDRGTPAIKIDEDALYHNIINLR
jgi:hypothetical protein